jgi:leader peptidase (prepilin peptidase)/N-methyltransferase
MTVDLPASWVVAVPWAEIATVTVALAGGATVGSFLNVVAHRVPRGGSVVAGGSRCPFCETRIRPRDNVPVLGWLLLGGRCRDCGAAIPSTYPRVEAGCGLLLATLAVMHLFGGVGGAASSPLDRVFVRGDAAPLLTWAGRAAMLMVLVAWSLLAARGHRPGVGMRALVILLAAVAAVLLPPLLPPGLGWKGSPWPPAGGLPAALASVATGCLCGLLVERVVPWWCVPGGGPLIGVACGWQGVVVQAALTALLHVVRWPDGRAGLTRWLIAAALELIAWDSLWRIWQAGGPA